MLNENIQTIQVTPLYRKIENSTAKTIVNVGGAGSSKSYSLSQFFIFQRLLKINGYRLLVLRKIRHSNKLSIYPIFIGLLEKYGVYTETEHNKSDLIYKFFDLDSYVRFAGLEDREQIKTTEWHDIWIEEANEFSYEDLLFLKVRLFRGELKNFTPRIWMSFNPVDCWIFDLESNPNVQFIWSNYKDNPFANEEYIKTLEGLKNEDETYYKIYALGQKAQLINLIFNPYMIETKYPENFDETIYGLDWGYNNPSAVLRIDIKDTEIYLTELLYQSKLLKTEVIEKLKQLIPELKRTCYMYGDNEDPSTIEEISQAGFNIHPCIKGKNSVKDSIDFCKRFKIHTKSENMNLNKERAGYKWKQDKNGNIIDEPVSFRDHLMACKRYALYSHFNQKNGKISSLKEIIKDSDNLPNTATVNQDF